MRKALSLLFIIVALAGADERDWDRVVLQKILLSVAQESPVRLYDYGNRYRATLEDTYRIVLVESCDAAQFVLVPQQMGGSNVCPDKPQIVFDYHAFKTNPDAVAVFFWQKGRPTIRFSEHRLQKFGLTVKGELSKFISKKM